ncbi:MAG: UDP-N-acetylmuramate--L-alanine ligase [Acidobacteria bacterium]|nr:UDP-N-acetylmuramate--L-alanine ligase [Acidobacteriota bacterium]
MVGIGGSGMCGIAEVLLNLKYHVSGSDLKKSAATERLEKLGARIAEGHATENVQGADVVVISSAVHDENPEVLEAVRLKVPVIARAEMLAELMRMKYGIAVAGSHGKTSTTSMIATVLEHGRFDPTVVIGGRLNVYGSNAKLGKGEFLVAEADESDSSFLHLSPTIAVVTNIDVEHMDHFGDLHALHEAFVQFMNKVPFYGAALVCIDDPGVQAVLGRVTRRIITYGTSAQADYGLSHVQQKHRETIFRVSHHGDTRGPVRLSVPGEHNALNAVAAIAVARDMGMEWEEILPAVESFQGADRRFQLKGESRGIMVIDDYGHHPTEVKATLAAARTGWEDRRIVVLFQPHRYTRTQLLFDQFCGAFHQADLLIITEIYPAGEAPIEGVSGEKLADGIRRFGHRNVHYCPDIASAVDLLAELCRKGDMVLTLGAGTVTHAGPELLKRIA